MFSFVSIDAKHWEPLALLVLAGIALWFMFTHLASKTAGDAAYPDLAPQPSVDTSTLTNLTILAKLFGTTTAAPANDQGAPVTHTSALPSLPGAPSAIGQTNPGSV
jgi:hypothetical protein